MRFYILFSFLLIITQSFEFTQVKKQSELELDIGKNYDLEEIKLNQIHNSLKKIELLKNNNLNSLFNKYFEKIDKAIDENLQYNPTSLIIHYPSLNWLYYSDQKPKDEETRIFFRELSMNINVLLRNESISLYKSQNEDLNKKLLELNLNPLNTFSISELSNEKISIYETLLIFELKNIDFKELIRKKFKNAKNIIFENYYYLIIF